MKFCLSGFLELCILTHWILALSDSLAALVI